MSNGSHAGGDAPRELSAEEVNSYLEEEERCLSQSILQAFQSPDEAGALSLVETVDRVAKRIREWKTNGKRDAQVPDFEAMLAHVNAAYRRYQEVLEGCASQLFAEMEQVRVDHLDETLLTHVARVKDCIVKQVNDSVSQFKRLESELSTLRPSKKSKWPFLSTFSRFFRSTLDRQIIGKLARVQEIVDAGYEQLHLRHQQYQNVDQHVRERQKKFKHYSVYRGLPASIQLEYAEIYRLIKIRTAAEKHHPELQPDVERILRDAVTTTEAVKVFRTYYRALTASLFEARRRMGKASESDLKSLQGDLAEAMTALKREVRTLGAMVLRFRDFLLSTHPDPYVRARLGFGERTVGPEPELTRRLMSLAQRVEALDDQIERFSEAVEHYKPERPSPEAMGYFDELLDRIEECPRYAKGPDQARDYWRPLLLELEEVEELYQFDHYRTMGMEKVLRLALRVDAYNVLVGSKKFEALYETHIQVRGKIVDQEQAERIAQLGALIEELRELRTDSAARTQSARVIAKGKVKEWLAGLEPTLDSLEEFLKTHKDAVPVPLEVLMGEVRVRRQEVLEIFYSYRHLMQILQQLALEYPDGLDRCFERINRIENDFNYLHSHHGRGRGPLSYQELKGLENF